MAILTPRAAATVLLCAAHALLAKDNDPLDRLTPVPASEPVPIVDFIRPPLFYDPQINEAGTHFAALFTDKEDRSNLVICDLATGKFDALVGTRNIDVYRYAWLGDTHLIVGKSKEKVWSLDTSIVEVGNLHSSYIIEAFSRIQVVGVPLDKPLQPYLWIQNDASNRGRDEGVIKINAKTHNAVATAVLVAYENPGKDKPSAYFSDKVGELAFAYTEKDGFFTLHRLEGKKWIACPIDLEATPIIGAGDQPGEIIVAGPRQEGKPRALQRMDAATGTLGEILYQDERYDPTEAFLYRHPVTRTIIGVQFSRTAPHTVWFDESYRALQKRLNASFPTPNTVLRILGSDKAEKRFVVAAINDRTPLAYYQIDLEKGQIGLIKSTRPWIDPTRMRPMQTMNYKTRDGFRIEGYLTLPEGASKEKPAPLIVLPHDGPQMRDLWSYNPGVQFLASRGYAVFQPNYRGSTTYQWQFPDEARWDFVRMREDVSDGVKAVLRTGLLDPGRVAIMGDSFGAYLALDSAIYDPSLYRCALTISGIFEWDRLMRETRHATTGSTYNVLRRHLGDPKTQRARFDAISPLNHVDQLKIPVFVADGKDLLAAQLAQSKRLVDQLKKNGVPHEAVFAGNEDRGLSYYENRMEVFAALELFLARHLAPAPSATTP